MNSKQVKKLRRRCEALWTGPLAGMLQERYGVGGFKRFLQHAKSDLKNDRIEILDILEEEAAARAVEDAEMGF